MWPSVIQIGLPVSGIRICSQANQYGLRYCTIARIEMAMYVVVAVFADLVWLQHPTALLTRLAVAIATVSELRPGLRSGRLLCSDARMSLELRQQQRGNQETS